MTAPEKRSAAGSHSQTAPSMTRYPTFSPTTRSPKIVVARQIERPLPSRHAPRDNGGRFDLPQPGQTACRDFRFRPIRRLRHRPRGSSLMRLERRQADPSLSGQLQEQATRREVLQPSLPIPPLPLPTRFLCHAFSAPPRVRLDPALEPHHILGSQLPALQALVVFPALCLARLQLGVQRHHPQPRDGPSMPPAPSAGRDVRKGHAFQRARGRPACGPWSTERQRSGSH